MLKGGLWMGSEGLMDDLGCWKADFVLEASP